MPRRSKGARLWLEPARRDKKGRVVRRAVFVIRDGATKRSTGFGEGEIEQAQRALADYQIARYSVPRVRDRELGSVKIADVISIYADDVAIKHARPTETAARLERLLDFFGNETLLCMNKRTCIAYVRQRRSEASARRELEDLRAAIRYHWENGYCTALTPVVLPDRSPPRDRWLTRSEAAKLLWCAWRLRQPQHGHITQRPTAQHVARFVLVALYTGTRAGAICGAALVPTIGRGWIDLDHGVFYRRPAGWKETKKRQPPVRLPSRLLAHMRRWARLGLASRAVVEWNREPVKKINKAFRSARKAAGLGSDVVPHTLRHTCATWLAQSGVPIWEAAGFMGMTAELFERVYGHHHPDYQRAASEAVGRSARQKRDRYNETESEQTRTRVVRSADKP
jgi:integrase